MKRPSMQSESIEARVRQRIGRLIGWRFSGNVSKAAEEMKVPYWPLYRVVKGKSGGGVPSLELIERIAAFFDMTYDELIAPDTDGIERKEREYAGSE